MMVGDDYFAFIDGLLAWIEYAELCRDIGGES